MRSSATLSFISLCVCATVGALPSPEDLAASRGGRNATSLLNGTMLFAPPPTVTFKDQRKGAVCILDARDHSASGTGADHLRACLYPEP